MFADAVAVCRRTQDLPSVQLPSRPRPEAQWRLTRVGADAHTVPGFPDRLRENPPARASSNTPEYLAVRAHLPAPWQDILDLAYYSGWRKNEILGLTWDEIDEAGGVIRLSPARFEDVGGADSPHLTTDRRGAGATAGAPRPRQPAGRAPPVIGTNSMHLRWSFATDSATICDRSASRSYQDGNLPRTF